MDSAWNKRNYKLQITSSISAVSWEFKGTNHWSSQDSFVCFIYYATIKFKYRPASIDYDYPSTPRSRATFEYLNLNIYPKPTSQVMEVMRQTKGANDRRFLEILRVIESREEERPSPYGPSSRSNSRFLEQGLCRKAPRLSVLPMIVRVTLTCLWFHLRTLQKDICLVRYRKK